MRSTLGVDQSGKLPRAGRGFPRVNASGRCSPRVWGGIPEGGPQEIPKALRGRYNATQATTPSCQALPGSVLRRMALECRDGTIDGCDRHPAGAVYSKAAFYCATLPVRDGDATVLYCATALVPAEIDRPFDRHSAKGLLRSARRRRCAVCPAAATVDKHPDGAGG